MRIAIACLVLLSSCGGAAAWVVEKPISNQCASAGLKNCEELTAGTLAYLNGDKAGGEPKIRAGAAGNSPEQIKKFTDALGPIADSAGGSTGESLRSVVALLNQAAASSTGEKPKDVSSVPALAGAPQAKAAEAPARTDTKSMHEKIRNGVVHLALDPRADECGAGLVRAGAVGCQKTVAVTGPLILTNVFTSGGCPDELFVLAGKFERPEWIVLAPAGAALNVTTQLAVEDGEPMIIGARTGKDGPKKDVKCYVTWSGYRP